MIYVKTHEAEERKVVAMCDEEILGKTFEENEVCLDVKKSFYGGKLVSEDEAVEIMRKADILNLVGERTIGLAIELGIVSQIHIIKIKGVPHAQVV